MQQVRQPPGELLGSRGLQVEGLRTGMGRGGELGEGSEIDGGEFAENGENLTFKIARGAKAGRNARQIVIVVTGMSNELPSAGGKLLEEGAKGVGVEDTGCSDGDGSVGCCEALLCNDAAEDGLNPAQGADLSEAHPRSAGRAMDRPGWLEGIADDLNSATTGGAENRPENGRKHVRVLVRVNVGEAQSLALQRFDLRAGFGLDFGGANAAGDETREKYRERAGKMAIWTVGEGRYLVLGKY